MVKIIFTKGEFMEQSDHNDKERLLYPHATYHGQVKPENLVFNANLQEFSHKVGYIRRHRANAGELYVKKISSA